MKGAEPQQEIEKARNAMKLLGGKLEKVEEFNLAGTDNKRSIIIIKKRKARRLISVVVILELADICFSWAYISFFFVYM